MAQRLSVLLEYGRTTLRSVFHRVASSISISSIVGLSWITIWIVICLLIAQDLSRDLVTIEPISVPKAFSEEGFTQEVASRRLQDALNKYASNAGSYMQTPNVASRGDLPDFVIPKIDLSLNAVISSIRSVLHYGSGQRISGEFIFRDKLFLRVRVDGREVFNDSSYSREPDELLTAAAPAVLEKIQPYLVASTLYNSEPERGLEKVDDIISRLKESDVNVQWSYILKGGHLNKQSKLTEAEEVLRKTLKLNWNNWAAHNNLGNSLRLQGRSEEAIAHYEWAIKINPRSAMAYDNLGIALRQKAKPEGKLDDAIAQFRRAIAIDPKYWSAHWSLAAALREQGNVDEAILEYRAAIKHATNKHATKGNRDLAILHLSVGLLLHKRSGDDGPLDDAVAEYRRAIEIDPSYSSAHNNLGVVLQLQGNLDDAINEFRIAVEADRNNDRAKNNLEAALRKKDDSTSD